MGNYISTFNQSGDCGMDRRLDDDGKVRAHVWRASLPDKRDFTCALAANASDMPPRVSHRIACPPVYEVCTPIVSTVDAVACLLEYAQLVRTDALHGVDHVIPSRAFLLHTALEIEQLNDRCGVCPTLRNCMKAASAFGVLDAKHADCAETGTPTIDDYDRAVELQGRYYRVGATLDALKSVLAAGHLVAFGMSMYHDFDNPTTARTGQIKHPVFEQAPQVLTADGTANGTADGTANGTANETANELATPRDDDNDKDDEASGAQTTTVAYDYDEAIEEAVAAAATSDATNAHHEEAHEEAQEAHHEDDDGLGATHVGSVCMVLVGYDDDSQTFIVRTPFGVRWGDGGYGYVPYAYVTDPQLSTDFWTWVGACVR